MINILTVKNMNNSCFKDLNVAFKENDFHLKLRDPIRNIDIQVNDLSTGEKVLMSLVQSLCILFY